jgi:hypothetical protein
VKKVLLVLVALVLVASGVAAVSAYEAHVVNVRAEVENALTVTTNETDFGTVFPEEWLTVTFKVKHSTSFCYLEQDRVDGITYAIYVARKPVPSNADPYPDPVDNISGKIYYPWLGDALYIGIFNEDVPSVDPAKKYPKNNPTYPQGALVRVTTDPDPCGLKVGPVLTANISKETGWGYAPNDWYDWVVVGLDVPVFDGSYNELTDPDPKPSGFNDPSVILTGERNVQGIILGADIKIQVIDIFTWPEPSP